VFVWKWSSRRSRKNTPDLDDDFAKEVGDYDNLEALRGDIRNRLEKRENSRLEMEMREVILGRLMEKAPLELPQKALERKSISSSTSSLSVPKPGVNVDRVHSTHRKFAGNTAPRRKRIALAVDLEQIASRNK